LRLADHPDSAARLLELQQVLRRHPGQASVYFTFRLTSQEADTAAIPDLTVLPSEGFVSEVEKVLGKGTVALL
jgi:DNA polymerase-3 subunit alpha